MNLRQILGMDLPVSSGGGLSWKRRHLARPPGAQGRARRPRSQERRTPKSPWALLMAVILAVQTLSCSPARRTLKPGDEAPAFNLKTLDGKEIRFPGDFSGRPVAIRFWADWCPFCLTEMSEIDPIVTELSGDGFTLLAVNAGQDEQTVRSFAKKVGFRYPALIDEEAATAREYGVRALPVTFFIRGDGRINAKLAGESRPQAFEKLARDLLKPGVGQ